KISQIAQIPHDKGERAITLKAFGDSDGFEDDMLEIADKEKDNIFEDYIISTGGENSDQQAFFAEIGILFLVVLLLVYLVIAFQLRSCTIPLLVFVSVYLVI